MPGRITQNKLYIEELLCPNKVIAGNKK